MNMRLFIAAVIAAATLVAGQGTALAAPNVSEVVCSLSQLQAPQVVAPSDIDAPFVKAVYRQTSGPQDTWEQATWVDGHYWSRTGGTDVVVELENPTDGYTFNLYKNRKLINSEEVSVCDPFVTVPLPTDEGTYARTFRYERDGEASPEAAASFGIDRTAPVIASVTRSAAHTATVVISEPTVEGTDRSRDWRVRWTVTTEGQQHTVYTQVSTVSRVDSQTLHISWEPDHIDEAFLGIDYLLMPGGERYRDAAGNGLADTIAVN